MAGGAPNRDLGGPTAKRPKTHAGPKITTNQQQETPLEQHRLWQQGW